MAFLQRAILVLGSGLMLVGCATDPAERQLRGEGSDVATVTADVGGQQNTGIVTEAASARGAATPYGTSETAAFDVPVASTMPAVVADEPTVEQPQWAVGDRWIWSDGYGLEVVSVDGSKTRMKRTDADDQWQLRDGFFLIDSQSSTTRRRLLFRTQDPAQIFPLKVGNRAVFRREYLSNGVLRAHNTSWLVVGRQTIRVPAGEFDTWVLERRTRSLKTEWTGFERIWYAPSVRNYVRMEYRYGLGADSARVLMAYRVSPTGR